jgi:O-antigen ligase
VTDEAHRERGSGADGTDVGFTPQDAGVGLGLGVVALAAWSAIAIWGGGIDLGKLPPDRGAGGLTLAVILWPAIAAAALWVGRERGWPAPARWGVAAGAGLVAWSALSIAWASAPDLAWLSTHRTAVAVAALVTGAAFATWRREPARDLALGVAVAAVPVLVWALASRVVPDLLAPVDDTSRLSAPIGHANGLALIAVFAVPGALLLASTPRWRDAGAVMGMGALVVVALTGSRSGLVALVATVALAVWLFPDRERVLAALAAAAAGAVPAVVYGLTAGPLTTTPTLPEPAERRGAGIILGALVVLGAVIAVVVRDPLAPAARRVARGLRHPLARRVLLVGAGLVVIAGGVAAAVAGRDASAGAGRTISVDSNHRLEWWAEAARGFAAAPLQGNGAGSFPLTHILERGEALDVLKVREPHQLALELMTELGVVGLLLGVAVVGCVAWAAWRAGRAAGPALCLVVAFLIQAQLDFPWTIPAASIPAMAAAGVVLGMGGPARPAHRAAGAARLAVAAAVAVGAIASAAVLAVADHRTNDAYLSDAVPARAIAKADRATGLNPLAIDAILISAKANSQLGERAAAIRDARRATDRQPDNPFAWECLAAVADEPLRAEAVARLAELDPARDPVADPPRCRPGW